MWGYIKIIMVLEKGQCITLEADGLDFILSTIFVSLPIVIPAHKTIISPNHSWVWSKSKGEKENNHHLLFYFKNNLRGSNAKGSAYAKFSTKLTLKFHLLVCLPCMRTDWI